MSLELTQIERLRMGPAACSVVVGPLPSEAGAYLGAKIPLVYLSRPSLDKIFLRHPDLNDYDLLMAPYVLDKGTLLTDREPNVLVAYWKSGANERLYKAVIKLAVSRYDVWLTAFYRTDEPHVPSLHQRGRTLRQSR